MARMKGARKGRTKRIGTKRMRKTSMKKVDKRKLGRRSSRRSKKSLRRAGRSMGMRGGSNNLTMQQAVLDYPEGGAPIYKARGKENTIGVEKEIRDKALKAESKAIETVNQEMRDMEEKAAAEKAAAEKAAAEKAAREKAAAEQAAREKAAAEQAARKNFEKFKKFLVDELYIYEEYEENDLTSLKDEDKLRALDEIKKLGLVGPNGDLSELTMLNLVTTPPDGLLISDMRELKVWKDRQAAKAEAAAKAEQERLAAAEKAEQERLYKVNMESEIFNFLEKLHLNIYKYDEGDLELRVDYYKKNKLRPDEANAATELVELIENLQVELDQLYLPPGIINELKNLKVVAEERPAEGRSAEAYEASIGNYNKVLPTDN